MTSLNLYGPVNKLGFGVHFTGWGTALSNLLNEHNFPVSMIPRGNRIDLNPSDTLPCQKDIGDCLHYGPVNFDPKAPSICLWHLPNVWEFAGSPRYFYTVWEATRPRGFESLKHIDGLIVPTAWHEQIAREHSDCPEVHVVPEGYDHRFYTNTGVGKPNRWFYDETGETLVLVNVGKFERRKGVEVLISALGQIARERSGKRPIYLLAHWSNPFLRDWFGKASKMLGQEGFFERGHGPGVFTHLDPAASITVHVVQPEQHGALTYLEMRELYRAGHVGIWPYFAEGWCLPLMESMGCGLPPICQDYSGPSEYLGRINECFFPLEGTESIANDGMFFHGDQGTWRQVKQKSLVEVIHTVSDALPDELKTMGNRASGSVLGYTWEHAARETLPVLKEMGIDIE